MTICATSLAFTKKLEQWNSGWPSQQCKTRWHDWEGDSNPPAMPSRNTCTHSPLPRIPIQSFRCYREFKQCYRLSSLPLQHNLQPQTHLVFSVSVGVNVSKCRSVPSQGKVQCCNSSCSIEKKPKEKECSFCSKLLQWLLFQGFP